MPNFTPILDNFIEGISLEETIRNRKKAVSGFLSFLDPQDANRFWEAGLRRFIDFLEPQAVIRIWQRELEKFLDTAAGETAETILEGLFGYMKFRFMIDPFMINGDFRKNIEDFSARYQFCSKDGEVGVLVRFDDGNMDWEESISQDVNATIEYKDGPALINYLINYVIRKDRDILRSLTENEIRVRGNFNYLFKFLFMVNHLLLEATGELPY